MNLVPVPTPLPCTAFFPGGFGLWRDDVSQPLPSWPFGGVMVLGHNFHSESGYRDSMEAGRESEQQPTWRHLLALLRRADIDKGECFFTSAVMGLATTGPFPGRNDGAFATRCQRFLRTQLAAQRPRLILTLGRWVPRLLAPLSADLEAWSEAKTFAQIDEAPMRAPVRFPMAIQSVVVALVHPSLRHLAVRLRRYKGLQGDDAEVAMLRDGLEAAR